MGSLIFMANLQTFPTMRKQTLLTVCYLGIILSSFCQTNLAPEFDGVKVDGSLDTITGKMLQKGFWIGHKEPLPLLFVKGDFPQVEKLVTVFSGEKSNLVYLVLAQFPPSVQGDTAGDLKRFDTIFETLTRKYGRPDTYLKGMRAPVIVRMDDTSTLVGRVELLFTKKYLVWPDKGVSIQLQNNFTTVVYYENYANADLEKKRMQDRKVKDSPSTVLGLVSDSTYIIDKGLKVMGKRISIVYSRDYCAVYIGGKRNIEFPVTMYHKDQVGTEMFFSDTSSTTPIAFCSVRITREERGDTTVTIYLMQENKVYFMNRSRVYLARDEEKKYMETKGAEKNKPPRPLEN